MTPLYNGLETNIPTMLMRYSDKLLPTDSQLFPRHETVKKYLEEYADEARHLISFKTQVLDVRLGDGNLTWKMTIKDLPTGHVTKGTNDTVDRTTEMENTH